MVSSVWKRNLGKILLLTSSEELRILFSFLGQTSAVCYVFCGCFFLSEESKGKKSSKYLLGRVKTAIPQLLLFNQVWQHPVNNLKKRNQSWNIQEELNTSRLMGSEQLFCEALFKLCLFSQKLQFVQDHFPSVSTSACVFIVGSQRRDVHSLFHFSENVSETCSVGQSAQWYRL